MNAFGKTSLKVIAIQLCLIAFLSNALIAKPSGPEPFGLALSVRGEVLLTRGILEFETKIEESLYYGDDIETGEDGYIIISFGSSFMSVGPNTSFSLAKKRTKTGKEIITVDLSEGRFRSKILNLRRTQVFQVVSEDIGTVTVYGTDLVTGITSGSDDSEGLDVSVLKGKVGVRANTEDGKPGPPVLIRRNESSSMGSDGNSTPVQSMSPQAVASIKRTLPLPGDDDEQPMTFAKKKKRQNVEKDKNPGNKAGNQEAPIADKKGDEGNKNNNNNSQQNNTGTGLVNAPPTGGPGANPGGAVGESPVVNEEPVSEGPGSSEETNSTNEDSVVIDDSTPIDTAGPGDDTAIGGDDASIANNDDPAFEPDVIEPGGEDFIAGGGDDEGDVVEEDPFSPENASPLENVVGGNDSATGELDTDVIVSDPGTADSNAGNPEEDLSSTVPELAPSPTENTADGETVTDTAGPGDSGTATDETPGDTGGDTVVDTPTDTDAPGAIDGPGETEIPNEPVADVGTDSPTDTGDPVDTDNPIDTGNPVDSDPVVDTENPDPVIDTETPGETIVTPDGEVIPINDGGGDTVVEEPDNPFENEDTTTVDDVVDTDNAVDDTFTDIADTNGTDESTVGSTGGESVSDSVGLNDELTNAAATELNIIFTIESGK